MSYIHDEGLLVKIFISEDDRINGDRLYKAIVDLAYNTHVVGVTVMRGFEGFGVSANIHSQRNMRASEDLPIIINAVDKRDRMEPFIDRVKAMLSEAKAHGFISISKSEMIRPNLEPKAAGK